MENKKESAIGVVQKWNAEEVLRREKKKFLKDLWHHQLNEPEFEQSLGDSERQGSLACYSPRGRNELDMTELLNNSNKGAFE